MQLTNPSEFLYLGGRIRYLVGVGENHPIGGEYRILHNLKQLRQSLSKLGFTVSINLFDNKLAKYVTSFEERIKKEGIDVTIAEDTGDFINAIINFESTVDAEVVTRRIAVPIPRRIPLEHLFESPNFILGEGVFQRLTTIAQEDFKDAAKCIGFECPTAAAFHVMRCIEECVRCLYKGYYPRKKIEKMTWGQLTHELSKKNRNPKPDPILLAHLDHLRNRFRNPTDHPEKSYDIEESEDLLHLAADVINRCLKDPKIYKS